MHNVMHLSLCFRLRIIKVPMPGTCTSNIHCTIWVYKGYQSMFSNIKNGPCFNLFVSNHNHLLTNVMDKNMAYEMVGGAFSVVFLLLFFSLFLSKFIFTLIAEILFIKKITRILFIARWISIAWSFFSLWIQEFYFLHVKFQLLI